MTTDAKLDAMSEQIAQLVQHVAEIRRTNVTLVAQYDGVRDDMKSMQDEMKSMRGDITSMQGEMKSMRGDITSMQDEMKSMRGDITSMQGDIRMLDDKIDKNTEFLVGKIDYHVTALRKELMRDRTRFEEEGYIRDYRQRKIEHKLADVEARVARLEDQARS